MNKLILLIIPVIVGVILVSILFDSEPTESSVKDNSYSPKEILFDAIGTEDENYYIGEDGKQHWISSIISLKENVDYSSVMNDGNSMFVIPFFTASAYESPGFYDYYNHVCDQTCLTAKMQYSCRSEASCNAVQILGLLGYDIYSDVDIDHNPEILNKYDTVIILHNEYVTQKEFDAITNHVNVLYLYPNSNYGIITTDYDAETITLVRGHGYPDKEITNGFEWKFDNTYPFEYDVDCKTWEFYDIDNGKMLNCYPEELFLYDMKFLKTIRDLSLSTFD